MKTNACTLKETQLPHQHVPYTFVITHAVITFQNTSCGFACMLAGFSVTFSPPLQQHLPLLSWILEM